MWNAAPSWSPASPRVGAIASVVPRSIAARSLGVSPTAPSPVGGWDQAVATTLGPPPIRSKPLTDQIASDVYNGPYRGPLDGIDPYGMETAATRFKYRTQYRENPIVRAAVRGKADDICVLEPAVLAQDRNDPTQAAAAEFVKWTIEMSPLGWFGLFDSIYTPGSIDGFSICEKKKKIVRWKGRTMWGFGHARSLDTAFLKYEMDCYRNVLSIVNTIRGLEYYSPDDCITYAHNPMYSSPFGQSDLRAATRAASIIEDAYKVWYVALKVYSLPYMYGKFGGVNKSNGLAIMQALRDGGYAVTEREDQIEVLNLASAAGTQSFQDFIHTAREDIFFAVRGVAQPFMEGDGGQNAHTDTSVQQGTSDAGEKAAAIRIAAVINEQVIPWLVRDNFGDIDMPRVRLGGTDWKQTKEIIEIFKTAKEIGAEPSAEQFYQLASIIPARDEADKLKSPEQPGKPGAGGPPQPGQPPAAPAAAPKVDTMETRDDPKPAPAAPAPPSPKSRPQPKAFSADHQSVDERAILELVSEYLGSAA